MKITKHAQSCFLIETLHNRILVDPGYFVFTDEGLKPEDFSDIDLLIITHEHKDHFDYENVKIIIENSNPEILCTSKIIEQIKNDYPQANIGVTGNRIIHDYSDFKIQGVLSVHGPLPNGTKPPRVSGFLITEKDTNITLYDPGDTVVLDANIKSEVIAVPICGRVVMDIAQAKKELLKLMPVKVIPIHYDNPIFPVDVKDFEKEMVGTGIEEVTLDWGQQIEL